MTRTRLFAIAGALSVLTPACGDDPAPTPAAGTSAPSVPTDHLPDLPTPLAPILGVPELADTNPDRSVVEVDLVAGPAGAELVAGHVTNVLAYNGTVSGPLLHARVGDRVLVHFQNALDEPTTIHWHGLRISSEMDGNPMIQAPIEPGASFTYDFVVPDAGTFWYHPHVNTVEQIDRGLYGPIVVAETDAPRFTNERMFVLDDIRLRTSDYQISPYAKSGMDWMMGRFGNTFLVNGKSAPAKSTVPRGAVERWHLLASSSAMSFTVGVEGAPFRVIGTDGGLLPAPYTTERVELAVGQRFDVEVTIDGEQGSLVRPVAYFQQQSADGTIEEIALPLAELTVDGEVETAPPIYPAVTLPSPAAAPIDEKIVLGAKSVGGKTVFTINGKEGMDVPVEEFTQGQPVRFTIENQIMHFHPFHLHGQFFQILSPTDQPGLKDTVFVPGNGKVTIETAFENPGEWMYHCHIPEHAELGMMAELRVVASK